MPDIWPRVPYICALQYVALRYAGRGWQGVPSLPSYRSTVPAVPVILPALTDDLAGHELLRPNDLRPSGLQ